MAPRVLTDSYVMNMEKGGAYKDKRFGTANKSGKVPSYALPSTKPETINEKRLTGDADPVAQRIIAMQGENYQDKLWAANKTSAWIKQNWNDLIRTPQSVVDQKVNAIHERFRQEQINGIQQFNALYKDMNKSEDALKPKDINAILGKMRDDAYKEAVRKQEESIQPYKTQGGGPNGEDVIENAVVVLDRELFNNKNPQAWHNKQFGGRFLEDGTENPKWRPIRKATDKERTEMFKTYMDTSFNEMYKQQLLDPLGIDPLNLRNKLDPAYRASQQKEKMAELQSKNIQPEITRFTDGKLYFKDPVTGWEPYELGNASPAEARREAGAVAPPIGGQSFGRTLDMMDMTPEQFAIQAANQAVPEAAQAMPPSAARTRTGPEPTPPDPSIPMSSYESAMEGYKALSPQRAAINTEPFDAYGEAIPIAEGASGMYDANSISNTLRGLMNRGSALPY